MLKDARRCSLVRGLVSTRPSKTFGRSSRCDPLVILDDKDESWVFFWPFEEHLRLALPAYKEFA
jgi:hypothetical protein